MKKATKILSLLLAAVLLVGATVAGTLAYLTSSDSVENSFTVGNVKITLDEAKVDANGDAITPEERVGSNTYKLLPGHEYDKDPTIHVDADSEDCWLFVKVENGLADIEADTKIAAQMGTNGWTLVNGTTDIYAYKQIAKAGEKVTVFETFKIDGAVVGGDKPENPATGVKYLADYVNAKIIVTAYAIQADGFTSAQAAWNAAGSSFTTSGN